MCICRRVEGSSGLDQSFNICCATSLIKSEVPQKVVVLQRKLLLRLLLKCKLVATVNDAKFPSGEHETVKPPAGPTTCGTFTPHTHTMNQTLMVPHSNVSIIQ